MSEMTLEQVRDELRKFIGSPLAKMADAIDAHLASQPAEQPRGDGVDHDC